MTTAYAAAYTPNFLSQWVSGTLSSTTWPATDTSGNARIHGDYMGIADAPREYEPTGYPFGVFHPVWVQLSSNQPQVNTRRIEVHNP